jgi:CRISPR type IV-associated protein Csf3
MAQRYTIRAEIGDAVILSTLSRFNPLDAVLAAAAIERMKSRMATWTLDDIIRETEMLPMEKTSIAGGNDFIYMDSLPRLIGERQLGDVTYYKANTYNKLVPYWGVEKAVETLHDRTGTLDQGRGPYKKFVLPFNTIYVDAIEWDFEGDPHAIEELMREEITHIGKKSAYASGRVRQYTVSPCNGPIVRTLPISDGEGVEMKVEWDKASPVIFQRLKPAYWVQSGRYLAGVGGIL